MFIIQIFGVYVNLNTIPPKLFYFFNANLVVASKIPLEELMSLKHLAQFLAHNPNIINARLPLRSGWRL